MKYKILNKDEYLIEIGKLLYVVNQEGFTILNAIDKFKNKTEVISFLAKEYNLSPTHVSEVLDNFLNKFNDTEEYDTSHLCLSAPLLIQWKVTNKCNLRCKHCYVEAGMTNNEISKSEKDIIFNRILAAKPFSVLFTGGECFEEPSTIEYMRRAYHEGIDIRVFTNGTNLEYFFDDLIEMSDRLTINVSLDGMESEHDFIRGKGNFNKTINNISGLIERNIQPSINIVINKINYKSIIDLLELLKSIKVKNVQVSHLTIFGNAISNKRKLAMDEKMYSEFNFYLESYLSKNLKGLNVTYKSFNHEEDAIETNDGETYEDTWTCCAGISRITVDHLGDVYPCPFLKNEYKLGNIINNDLHFLWQDPNRIKFIENLKKNSKNGKCLYF